MKKLACIVGVLLLGHVYFASAASCSFIVKNDLTLDSETNEVLNLQNFLMKKGLFKATPNGYFGPNTRRAVMAYQDSVGLPDTGNVFTLTRQVVNEENCTGIVPVVTSDDQAPAVKKIQVAQPASCVDLPNNLMRGDENSYVLKLQNFFVKKGLLNATPNGYYGVGTTAAVKAYQEEQGFKVTGDTLTMMREEIKKETCLADTEVIVSQDITLPQGCVSRSGFSTLTGVSCSTVLSLPAGCTSSNGFSVTTGVACTAVASQSSQTITTPVTQSVLPPATTTEVYTRLSLQLTPNSPGLAFVQNSTHVKLATVTIHSPDTFVINSFSLVVASSSVPANTISNFTITDVGQDKVINGGPLFTFTNQIVLANQPKVYEIYGDIGAVTPLENGFVDFNGGVTLRDNGSTTTNLVIPLFRVLLSK